MLHLVVMLSTESWSGGRTFESRESELLFLSVLDNCVLLSRKMKKHKTREVLQVIYYLLAYDK